jgi:hypothetical protein
MAKIDELKSLAADLRGRLKRKAVDQLTDRASEWVWDSRRKRDQRANAKEVNVPPCRTRGGELYQDTVRRR